MSIRVLISDDQRLFRQRLRYLLEQEENIEVVGFSLSSGIVLLPFRDLKISL